MATCLRWTCLDKKGDQKLFSRGGQKPFVCLKSQRGWGKGPLMPSPADAYAWDWIVVEYEFSFF